MMKALHRIVSDLEAQLRLPVPGLSLSQTASGMDSSEAPTVADGSRAETLADAGGQTKLQALKP